jgi:hypothetical protein
MPPANPLSTLASYVPPLVARSFVNPIPPTVPTATRFPAAVLVVIA